MKKIKTLFKRDMSKQPALVINEVNEGCEWVINGEGKATRKYDGCCCVLINIWNKWIFFGKRCEVKKGNQLPKDFIKEEYDEITGKTFGWVHVEKNNPSDKWFTIAFDKLNEEEKCNFGTYELLGKGSQGDAEHVGEPILQKHSEAEVFEDCPRTYDELREWLKDKDIEGIVWHHEDGRMVKLKKKDFGFKR